MSPRLTPRHEGALGGSSPPASEPLRPPPSARRLSIDRSRRRKCRQITRD